MKKRLVFLLVALLVASVLTLTACGAKLVDTQFTAPTKTTYQVGESLDLSGSKITYVYSDDSTVEVDVTSAMLDASSVPSFTEAGTFTVTGTHEEYNFEFTVTVEQPAPSYSFVAPTKLTYVVGETLDLAGAQVLVDGTPVAVTTEMLYGTVYTTFTAAGTFTLQGVYQGYQFEFTVTVNSAYSFVAPTKLTYVVGETLDLAGAQVVVDGTPVAVITEMLTASTVPTMETAGTFTVEGTYQGYAFSFAVTVKEPVVYTTTFATADGSWSVTVDTVEGQLPVFPGRDKYTKTAVYTDPIFDRELTPAAGNEMYVVTFTETPVLTVSQAKVAEIGSTVYVQGVVIAVTNTADKVELLVREDGTNNVISFNQKLGLGTTGAMGWGVFEKGDRVVLSGVMTKYTASMVSGETNKVYVKLTQDLEEGAPFIIEKGQDATLIKEQAVVIDSQEDLKALLEDRDARGQNQYTYVKLVGPINLTPYYGSSTTFDTLYWRLWFGDITKAAEQRIDSASPVFRNNNASHNAGLTVSELLFGEKEMPTSKDKYTTPQVFDGEIYAIFVGGNKYYHQFAILSTEDVVHKVTYDYNFAGSQTADVVETFVYPNEYSVKTAKQLSWNAPENYFFAGWNTKADGTGKWVETGANNTVSGTLYAIWTCYYTLTPPTKLTYDVGDTFSLAGSKLVWSNGNAQVDVAVYESMLKTPVDMTTAGEKVVTIVYEGIEFTFTVNVVAPTYNFVAPTKTTYDLGEALDLAGGTITETKAVAGATTVEVTTAMLKEAVDMTTAGEKTVTLVYAGQEFTYTINVVAPVYEFTAPTKTAYDVDEALDFTGGKITVTKAVAGVSTVDLVADMLKEAVDTTTAGKKTVTFVYAGNEYSYEVEVVAAVTTLSLPTQTKFDVGERFNFVGATLTITYVNKPQEVVDLTIEMLDAIPSTATAGKVVVTGHYQGYEFSYEMEVRTYELNFVAPTTLSYAEGQVLSMEGAQIVYTYQDGSTKTVPATTDMLDATTIPTMFEQGTFTVKGSFETLEFSFDVTVEVPTASFVAPLKTVYKSTEELDLTGAKIVYTFSDGSTSEVAVAYTMLQPLQPDLFQTEGTHTVYGSYKWFEFNFDIRVITHDVIFTAPSKLVYDVTETFDITGATILYDYFNREDELFVVTADMVVNAPDMNVAGEQTIMIAYDGLTFEFTITLKAPQVVVIAPTQVAYDDGDALNLDGATVTLDYSTITDDVATITADMLNAYTLVVGENTITGNYKGYEFSFTVTVHAITYTLTAPTQVIYDPADAINLVGGFVTVTKVVAGATNVDLTADMLKQAVDTTTAGEKVVTIVYAGNEFTYTVQVVAPTYAFTAPTKVAYGEGETLDLAGGYVTVTKAVAGATNVDLTADMLNAYALVYGDNTITGSYQGYEFSFVVTADHVNVTEGETTYCGQCDYYQVTVYYNVEGQTLSQTFDANAKQDFAVPTLETLGWTVPEGKFFVAFNSKATADGAAYLAGESYDLVANSIYAVWRNPYTFTTTFKTADDSWSVTVDTVEGQLPVFPGRDKYTKTVVYTDPVFDREFTAAAGNETYVVSFTETAVLTVSQAKAAEIGSTVYVQGIVIAVINNGDKIELLVREDGTNNIIGFNQKLGLGTTSVMKWNVFAVGDRVVLGGTLTQYVHTPAAGKESTKDMTGEAYKVYVKLTKDLEAGAPFIIEKGCDATLIKDQAVVIDSQDALKALLEDPIVRGQNQYTFVKLVGPINLTPYYGSSTTFDTLYWRLWFGDITGSSEQRIHGTTCSPVFRNNNASFNAGYTLSEMFFGETTMPTAKDLYTAPQVFNGTVYAIFVGGNIYYHQFAVIDVDHVERTVTYDYNVEGSSVSAVSDTRGYVDYTVKTVDQLGWTSPQEGYTFAGWNTSADGSGTMIEAGSVDKYLAGTLYAIWADTSVDRITGVETASNPTKTARLYDATLDLTGATITVKHSKEADETIAVTADMLDAYTLVAGVSLITGTYQGFEFTLEVTVSDVYSVAEVKNLEVNDTVTVRGIVMGVAEAPNSDTNYVELLLRDEATNTVIGVYGEALGLGTYSTLTLGKFAQGDVVEIPAQIVKYSTTYTYNGNYGKVWLQYIGTADDVESCIKEHGKAYAIDPTLGGYETVTNQAELLDALTDPNSSGANRPVVGGQYKVLKLSGTIYTTSYYSSSTAENCEWWRIWFDPNVSSLAEQAMFSYKPGSITYRWSPSFRAINQDVNTGIETIESMFGCEMHTSVFAPNHAFNGDVYVIWIGGNAYYAQLVIVSLDNVTTKVTYNYNNDGSEVADVVETRTLAQTSVKTIEQLGWTAPSGYKFVGWNTAADGTGNSYTTLPTNFAGTLYAVWEEEQLAHEHTPGTAVVENSTPATCTAPGSYDEVVYCTECHEVISRTNKVEAQLDHTPGEWTITVEPTHLAGGTKEQRCTVCNTLLNSEDMPVVTVTFVAPTKVDGYALLDIIDVAGGSITFNYTHKEPVTVALTAEMLSEYALAAGDNTITVTYEGYTTTFVVKAAAIPFTLSQAKALWETNPDKVTANGVKGYIAAFDTPSDSGTTVSGVYLTDEQTVYLISFTSVQLADLTYKVSDEVVVSNAALDHTNGGRVLTGTIQSVTATDKKLDLSAIQPDVVITTQDEMTAWAKETIPAKGLIVKFEGLFSFVGTNKTGQGQGTRLNLNYAEAAEFGTADYTWKASENKTKTLSFKYGSNNLLLEKWWQVVGGRDDDESKKCLPCGGSFVAISGGFGATLWSWNIFDADRFDAHVRTAVEWAPMEIPTMLESDLEAVLGTHVLETSTKHVTGINWTLAEPISGVTLEDNVITLENESLSGVTVKLAATFETYTVTVERTVTWVVPPAVTVTEARTTAQVDTIIVVEGLFVGVADEGNGYQKEIVLKDPANDNLIAVQGVTYGTWPNVGYTKGDLVRLTATLKQKTPGDKKYLEFAAENPSDVEQTIVSKGNAVTYNLDNVVTLENWDAWKTTFVVDTLPMYTYIRIKGTVYLNKLNSTSSSSGGVTLYRPHMNPAPTNLTGMKPDGTRAIGFRDNVLKANLGSTTWSTYFSGKSWSTSYTFTETKYQKEVDIIAVYTNANGVNFMLTILEADWLK